MNDKAAGARKVPGFKFGKVELPIKDVVICPVTGRALVRDGQTAVSQQIDARVHAALSVPAGKSVGRLAAGCATYVDPGVDEATAK